MVLDQSSADGGEAMPAASSGYSRIPRIIWLLWFDGWDQATELHHRCLESWQLYNIGWEVRALSRADFPGLLGDLMPRFERLTTAMNVLEKWGSFWIPPASESDLLRLILLERYGGVWADSTMLCRRPLDSWLPAVAASGFFAFAPESIEEQLPVMSSFLASEPGHQITAAWLESAMSHWSTPSREDLGFFWVHKLFGSLMGTGSGRAAQAAQAAWVLVPQVTGEYGKTGPHFFVPYTDLLGPPPGPELKAVIEQDGETPMFKLTNHEVRLESVGPESCYRVLLEETRRAARAHAIDATGGLLAVLSSSGRTNVLRKLLAPGNMVSC